MTQLDSITVIVTLYIFQVAIAPEIENIIAVPNKTIVAGSPLVLDCRAKGHPLPEFTWIKTSDKVVRY